MSWRTIPAIALIPLLLAPNSVRQEVPSWIGRKVVTKWQTPLRVGTQIADDNTEFRVYTVDRVKGDWLSLVFAPGNVSGWVRSAKVVPFDEAIDYYTREIRANPDSAYPYVGRGLIWREKGETEIAIADFDDAIRLEPTYGGAYINRGLAWTDQKKYHEAIADFNRAIRCDPASSGGFQKRGVAWICLNEYGKAMADLDEAIRLGPKDFYGWINRGYVWSKKQEYDKAIADLNETIRLNPKFSPAWNSRGYAWLQKKEYDKAIADYSEAIRLDPKDPIAWFDRGHAQFQKAEYDKAITDFSESIRLNPNDADTFGARGYSWSLKRDYAKAIADYEESIRLDDPKLGNAFVNRAWLWATCPDEKYRDGKRAVESATLACEMSHWKVASQLKTLAAASAEVGDFAKAVEFQEKANTLEDEAEEKRQGEERLAGYRSKKPFRTAP